MLFQLGVMGGTSAGWGTPHWNWMGIHPVGKDGDGVPPFRKDLGIPLSRVDGYPPPPSVDRKAFPSINITFPCTMYAGGKKQMIRDSLARTFMGE